ncbi:MAG TPA: L,D-transpeptidase family protein [Anaerolineales bacterium]|nr:L,D-transpeptidase family protein [Anaerolineales bacterium]HNS60908.1 L,D-transpeptidase family protein [Anaerolineales bacterium]
MQKISRRDFLKLGGASLGAFAFAPALGGLFDFDDSDLIRVATTSVSVYSKPSDDSSIVSTWYRDELLHSLGEVIVKEPEHNPVWYRVWGGYIHRARLQKVKILFNNTLTSIEEGTPRLAEVTVPYSQPWRTSQAFGWQQLGFRLYYGSIHWIEAIEPGPNGDLWYRIYDDLTGFPYYIDAKHLKPVPFEELTPITPEIPVEHKRIEVNLTNQTLMAFEYDKQILKTSICSGIPNGPRDANGIPTKTPAGEFRIMDKMPNKHMGNGNLFADFTDYELPGVPWTCFFTDKGHAFHGTYWHENFGVPMSRGCINMRTEEAKWLFRWAKPDHQIGKTFNRGFGTLVRIYY